MDKKQIELIVEAALKWSRDMDMWNAYAGLGILTQDYPKPKPISELIDELYEQVN